MRHMNTRREGPAAAARKLTTEIIALNREGRTHVEISEILGVERHAIGALLRQHGLRSPYVRTRIIHIGNGMVRCTKCDRELPQADLPWGRVTKDPYQLSYCRKCLTAQSVFNTQKNIDQYLKHRQRGIRSRCKETGVEYALQGGYLADLFRKQSGRCFYTDLPMKVHFGTKKPGARSDSVSVDRIEPDSGYVVGNVVLCTSRANAIKSNCSLAEMRAWLPDWWKRIERLREGPSDFRLGVAEPSEIL